MNHLQLPLKTVGGERLLTSIAIALLTYICAVGSIPIVSALLKQGLCIGGGLVILILGSATNTVSIMTLSHLFGKRFTITYITILLLSTLSIALAIEYLVINL